MSALPLAPFVADAVWGMLQQAPADGYRTPPQFTLGNPYRLTAHAPAGFARFINQTLAQTLISPAGVFLALWYIAHRMPLFEGGGEDGVMFRDELLSCARKSEGEAVARRVITLGLAWANKWLDDNTFTNRSWCVPPVFPASASARLAAG